MTLHINDGGTWRTISSVHVNDGGTWRDIQSIWVKDSSTWRQVFVKDVIAIANVELFSQQMEPGTATCDYILQNDGDVVILDDANTNEDIGDWITPKVNMANYEVRATVQSGTASFTEGTFNTWQVLSTTRSWRYQRSLEGFITCNVLYEIRHAASGVVKDTAVVTFTAEIIPE